MYKAVHIWYACFEGEDDSQADITAVIFFSPANNSQIVSYISLITQGQQGQMHKAA